MMDLLRADPTPSRPDEWPGEWPDDWPDEWPDDWPGGRCEAVESGEG
jgi:hypothetical protein